MTEAEKKRQLKKQAIIDYMKILPVKKYAAANAGINEDTLLLWLKKDKEFSDKVQESQSEFFRDKSKRAKPEFLLERLDRETFGDKKTLDVNVNPVDELLKAYGIDPEGVQNGRETDAIVSEPSESEA